MPDKVFFVGDHAALDFLNTVAAPRGEVIESIADGEAYVNWLADAGLLDAAEARVILDRFGAPALDKVAAEARDLREWFRRRLTKPAAEAITKLNQILAMDCVQRQLERSGRRLVLQEKRVFTQARQLLTPVVQAIAELVTDDHPSLIKRCANPPCTLWFYDRTKAHRRRFCSAAVCGNRTKVAAFRARQRQGEYS